jgi:hypothetical protein
MFERSPSSGGVSAGAAGSTPGPSSSSGTADSRYHYALQYLARFEYPVELRTLAAHVAAKEQSVPADAVSDDERERVAIRLHHVDIPKLIAESVVDYDPESRMVVSTIAADATERYADISDRSRQSDAV